MILKKRGAKCRLYNNEKLFPKHVVKSHIGKICSLEVDIYTHRAYFKSFTVKLIMNCTR